MKIPIKNIYWLLFYAWKGDPLCGKRKVVIDDIKMPQDLLGMILKISMSQILTQGLTRNYKERTEEIIGLRGRPLLALSASRRLLAQGKSICLVDELDTDIACNQIAKAAITKILKTKIDSVIAADLHQILNKLISVSEPPDPIALFRNLQLGSNDRRYQIVIECARLIFCSGVPNTEGTGSVFRDFRDDDKLMEWIFEEFVRQFAKRHVLSWKDSRSSRMHWGIEPNALIPSLKTDITLTTEKQSLIVETKCNKEIVQSNNFSQEKVRSSHLQQLYSYLGGERHRTNLPPDQIRGLLLYAQPEVGVVNTDTRLHEFNISIRSLNLNREWSLIDADLREWLKPQ